MIHKRSTALERSVKYFTGGLKPVSRHQRLVCSKHILSVYYVHRTTNQDIQ